MKKIAIITLDYLPSTGGIAVYWSNLFKHVSDRFYIIAPPADVPVVDRVIRIPFLYSFVWPRWLRLLFRLSTVLRTHAIERVIVGQIIPVGTVVWLLHMIGVISTYYVSCHAMDVSILQGRKRAIAQVVFSRAEKIIVNSAYTQSLVIQYGVSKDDIVIVEPCPNVLPDSFVDIRKRHDMHDGPIMLSVGRLVERKGIDAVIAALPAVWNVVPNALYCIVGAGDDESRLRHLVDTTLPVTKRNQVVFAGRVSDSELSSYYKAASVFVLPTKENTGDVEGFGIVNLEAGLYQLPVVAGVISGKTKSVIHNKTGLLVQPDNKESVAQSIILLLTNRNLAQQMGQAGFVYATSFSWRDKAKQLEHTV